MERNNGLPSMTWTVIQYLFLSYMNKGVKKANGKHQESWRLLHNPPDMLTLQVLTQSNTRLKISHMDAKKIEKKNWDVVKCEASTKVSFPSVHSETHLRAKNNPTEVHSFFFPLF